MNEESEIGERAGLVNRISMLRNLALYEDDGEPLKREREYMRLEL